MTCFNLNKGVSDILKVISALLVMLSHYCNLKAQTGAVLNPIEWALRSQGGNIGVAIFFFLSGYGLMCSELNAHICLWKFIKRRILKIYLPVVLVTALWLPIAYNITPPHNNSLIVRDLIWGFRDPVLWFIKVLIILYVGFFLFSLILRIKKTGYAIIVLFLSILGACFFSFYTNGSFGINSISGIPLFGVGVISALYPLRVYKGLHISIIPLVACFMCVSLFMSFYPRFIANVVHVAADYVTVGIIILFFTHFSFSFKVPVILALLTFDIYLVHFKILEVMTSTMGYIPLLGFIVVTVMISVIFFDLRKYLIRL